MKRIVRGILFGLEWLFVDMAMGERDYHSIPGPGIVMVPIFLLVVVVGSPVILAYSLFHRLADWSGYKK